MDSELMRVTAHSTALKLGRQPDPKKPELKDHLKDSDVATKASDKHIETIGFNLTYAQDRALHAVQVLLDDTDYEGNAPMVKPKKARRYQFDGELPVMEIATADFLRAYGVKRTKTNRGWEFSPQARRIAVGALKDLSFDQYLIVYEKSQVRNSIATKKSYTKVQVEDVAPLIALEVKKKGRVLKITPNPILVDQIKSYYVLKPRNFFDLVTGKDVVAARFLEYLLKQGEGRRRASNRKNPPLWEIRISAEAMAWQLRLDAMMNARKKSAIREKLTLLYKLGGKVGYLKSYKIDQEGSKGRTVDVLTLKKSTFEHLVPLGAKSSTKRSKI